MNSAQPSRWTSAEPTDDNENARESVSNIHQWHAHIYLQCLLSNKIHQHCGIPLVAGAFTIAKYGFVLEEIGTLCFIHITERAVLRAKKFCNVVYAPSLLSQYFAAHVDARCRSIYSECYCVICWERIVRKPFVVLRYVMSFDYSSITRNSQYVY